MSSISILFDRSESDELGIRLTAREMGVDMNYIPFYKVAVGFGRSGLSYRSVGRDFTEQLKDTRVVLNRAQSKNRRIFAASILETLGKNVVNNLNVEQICSSKVRILLTLFMKNVNIPETVYVPSNVHEPIPQGGVMDNTQAVALLIEEALPDGRIVVKPDGGTHGRGIALAERGRLDGLLQDISPSIINLSGVLAQEYVLKWFYDLRIIVHKQAGGPVLYAPAAMARAGFDDFRTNTYLGNKIFSVVLPPAVVETATRGGEALMKDREAGLLAFDAMPFFHEYPADESAVKSSFNGLDDAFEAIQVVKGDLLKKKYFEEYTEKLGVAYLEYTSTEAYHHVQSVIQESLNAAQDSVVIHECNACPEFWEQTQQITGVNVANLLIEDALSLL